MTSMRMYNVPTKFGPCIKIANFQAKPPSTVTRYVCILVLIQFLERFQIDAFSMKTISVLVWTEKPKRIEIFCVSKRKRSSVDGAKVVIKKKKKWCLKSRKKTFEGIGINISSLGCAISVRNN